ncbi:MAG: outer membrane beta-barrel protein [Flavobacteriales bacterium]
MKKIISLILSIFITILFYGQTKNPSVDFSEGMGVPMDKDLHCVKKGNIIISPWYGLGTINLFPESDSLENFKSLYLRPMGFSAEYMVTDDVGVGIDFIYNRQGYSATDPNNIDGSGNLVTYNYNLKTERTRIHIRFNYHFTKDENFDGYLGIGAGTNSRKNSYTSNDPYFTDEYDDTELLPFSVRVCLGGRYFFSENYGLVGEIGLGGALLRGGLSIKF